MNDRELLELAAKAAGYKIAWECGCVTGWKTGGSWWNPLTDDGDALRLAVDLVITDLAIAVGQLVFAEGEQRDIYATTRRAIVRAAAELAKEAA